MHLVPTFVVDLVLQRNPDGIRLQQIGGGRLEEKDRLGWQGTSHFLNVAPIVGTDADNLFAEDVEGAHEAGVSVGKDEIFSWHQNQMASNVYVDA